MNQNDRSGARDVSVGDRQQPSRPPRGVNPSRSDPWPVDDPAQAPGDCGCGCAKAPRPPATPCNHPIVKPKGDDCCRQILDALKSMPGFDERRLKLHKPKQSTKVKLANRCCLLPVKDCLAPMLMLGLRRFRDGVVPANTFEAKTQGVLQAMSQQRRDALLKALNAYDATPAGRKDCAVDIRFDDWPSDQALDP